MQLGKKNKALLASSEHEHLMALWCVQVGSEEKTCHCGPRKMQVVIQIIIPCILDIRYMDVFSFI